MEELGYVDPGTALSYLAHSILCVKNLASNASEAQIERFLPDLLSGKKLGGMGMTEPGSGSDAIGMQTRASPKDSGYILNGSKCFITNAPWGETFVVYARTGERKSAISTFIVESSLPGFNRGAKLKKMGMRSSPTGELHFHDMKVNRDCLVGAEGQSVEHMVKGLDLERITISGISLGLARRCLDVMLKYSQERQQFGKPIAEFQMIQQMVADSATELAAARALVYTTAAKMDQGKITGSQGAAQSKLFAAQMGTRVALRAIQVLGGYGYAREYQVERLMRDAKLLEIGAGTNEIMRYIIAKELWKDRS
jgi:isovaleryl-CoA dehydrogenase